jgi:hypothetical protein
LKGVLQAAVANNTKNTSRIFPHGIFRCDVNPTF